MTIVGTINVLGKEIVVRVSETKIDDFGIKTSIKPFQRRRPYQI